MTGEIIVLNGTSSAGKSSLAAAMQTLLSARGRCWLIFGIDDFLSKVPAPWVGYFEVGPHADEGLNFVQVGDEVAFTAGPVGRAVLTAYHRTIATLALSGVNVIVDDVVVDADAWTDWQSALHGLQTFWVRVDCPAAVCEARAQARGDRLAGLARSQAQVVHRHPSYDLAVDTSTATPAELARAVIDSHGSVG